MKQEHARTRYRKILLDLMKKHEGSFLRYENHKSCFYPDLILFEESGRQIAIIRSWDQNKHLLIM
jgi:hypothetical protein